MTQPPETFAPDRFLPERSLDGRFLSGRTALVTGSTAGLGLAIAQGLAEAGCNIVMTGLAEPAEVESQRLSLASSGVDVAYLKSDLTTLDGVESLVAHALDRFDGVDILVNNAVVRHFAPIVGFPPENWDAAIAVNLSAAFHAIRLLLPQMQARNFGRIFNMTSVYGSRGTVDRVDYVTTKAALQGLTRSVALENLDYDVTCHSICPGSVLTPGTEGRVVEIMQSQGVARADAERSFLAGKQPSGRFVSAKSVSDLLLFLCGPVARDMTGSLLPVEAGWLAS
ncbi:SDR family NAD(P)-dependent oxidoreductase [Ensifer soli]|uniref:SDR family NAD(P)-dependent oxidoreductase n=1 Tax=Ciceribacter sp. sgz301302 TaxID=3342379 RepID=UPI0035BB5C6E